MNAIAWTVAILGSLYWLALLGVSITATRILLTRLRDKA